MLGNLYPESVHVSAAGLTSASDLRIWNFSLENGLVIVTKDRDFQEFSLDMGHPPKVIAITTATAPLGVLRAFYERRQSASTTSARMKLVLC